jgi:hypothetical protein
MYIVSILILIYCTYLGSQKVGGDVPGRARGGIFGSIFSAKKNQKSETDENKDNADISDNFINEINSVKVSPVPAKSAPASRSPWASFSAPIRRPKNPGEVCVYIYEVYVHYLL